MDAFDFCQFVNMVKDAVLAISAQSPERFTLETSPTECERIVVEASGIVISRHNLNCKVVYTEGSHIFPDIVYVFESGARYGIEVKSSVSATTSENNWMILGNSILGSTETKVVDLHIVFIKINCKGVFVNNARYADAIADVVVTHSPRYKIDLSQNPDNSFFNRSGISYENIKNASNPIALVTDYFRRQGETAWWLSESTSATIKEWNDISSTERGEIYGKAFLFFHELLSSQNSVKYKRFAKWLVSTYSVVDSSLRDKFTAGGKVTLYIEEYCYDDLPKIFQVFQNNFSEFARAMNDADLDILRQYWDSFEPINDCVEERKQYWLNQIRTNLIHEHHILEFVESLIRKIN